MNDCTLTGNTSLGGPGGAGPVGYISGSPGTGLAAGMTIAAGSVVVDNTIISDNKANGSVENDISGKVSPTSSHNLTGTGAGLANGASGNKTGINNPQLMPLGWYGGPTETMLPMPASPAINAGTNSLIPSGVKTDQRGDPRISGSSVDIGSDEFSNVTAVQPTATSLPSS